MICNLCPRNCNALRTDTEGSGLCGMPALPVAARAAKYCAVTEHKRPSNPRPIIQPQRERI